jgi:hypothetical protein
VIIKPAIPRAAQIVDQIQMRFFEQPIQETSERTEILEEVIKLGIFE